MPDIHAEQCPRLAWPAALEILFDHLTVAERDEQIAKLFVSVEEGTLSLEGLLWCKDGGRPVGAMLCVAAAGRTLMIWPPRAREELPAGRRRLVERCLLTTMRQYAQCRRCRLVQLLLNEADQSLAPVFLAAGFLRLTRLAYLRQSPAGLSIPPPPGDLEYACYRPERHADFLQVLHQTYEHSLDCAELSGVRTLDESLETHKAQGEFDPDRWFLLCRQGGIVGCLLLVGLPSYASLEIAYVGVTPNARGQGLGRELTRQALRVGQQAGVEYVTLAVDDRNLPARRIYEAEGFAAWDTRDAYLLILDPAGAASI